MSYFSLLRVASYEHFRLLGPPPTSPVFFLSLFPFQLANVNHFTLVIAILFIHSEFTINFKLPTDILTAASVRH